MLFPHRSQANHREMVLNTCFTDWIRGSLENWNNSYLRMTSELPSGLYVCAG